MATAEELLAGVSVVDKTLVISHDLRTINIPSSVRNLGVESDDDVLRLDFKMPRYLGDIDLSKFSIRINYINAKAESDIFTVNNPAIGAQYITFSWLVGPTATRYKGDIKFNVCLRILDSDGYVDREYNTTPATLPVLEGLEVDEGSVEQYSDLLEQWRAELFGIGDTEEAKIKATSQAEQDAIENKGSEVLATIPADYQTAVSMVESADRTKADAITCSMHGEVINVSDSSDDRLRGLKVFGKTTQISTAGKNLLDTTNLVKFVNNMGSEKTGVVYLVEQDGEYAYYIADTVTTYIGYSNSLTSPATHYTSALKDKPAKGTITLRAGQYFMLWFDTGITVKDPTKYTLAFGSEVTYEPYSGCQPSPSPNYPQELVSVKPTVTIHGKNLFNIESINVTQQTDGGYLLPQYPKKTIIQFPNGYSGPITISGWIKYESTESRGGFIEVVYVDGTNERVVGAVNSSLEYQRYAHTTDKNKLISEVLVSYGVGTVVTYFKDIQVEFGTKATVYEPYVDQVPLTLEHNLPGIPVSSDGNYTDANGQQWICDEIDFERGVYVQRIHTIVLDGTESISREERSGGTYRYVLRQYTPVRSNPTVGGYCSHFKYDIAPVGVNDVNDVMCMWTTGYPYCRVDGITSVDEMIAWLEAQYAAGTPVTIKHVRETPIETPLTAEEIAAFRSAHTNFPNTTVLNDAGTMVELKYNVDTKSYIDNKITNAILVATVE